MDALLPSCVMAEEKHNLAEKADDICPFVAASKIVRALEVWGNHGG